MRHLGWVWGTMLLLLACTENTDTTNADTAPLTAMAPDAGARLVVSAPWARVAPEGGTSAVYLHLENGTTTADTLLGVASGVANLAEVHESYVTDAGARGMRPVPALPVPAGATVRLQPGSYHIMLIQLRQALGEGDTVGVDLTFAHAGIRSLRVPVHLAAP